MSEFRLEVTESSIDKWLREFQRKHDGLRHIGLEELRELAYALHDDIPMGYEASMRLADWLLHVAPTPNGETCHNASKVMDEHGQARFACSECGAWIDSRMLWNPEYRNGESPWVSGCKLNFCPNCGRKVVDE